MSQVTASFDFNIDQCPDVSQVLIAAQQPGHTIYVTTKDLNRHIYIVHHNHIRVARHPLSANNPRLVVPD